MNIHDARQAIADIESKYQQQEFGTTDNGPRQRTLQRARARARTAIRVISEQQRAVQAEDRHYTTAVPMPVDFEEEEGLFVYSGQYRVRLIEVFSDGCSSADPYHNYCIREQFYWTVQEHGDHIDNGVDDARRRYEEKTLLLEVAHEVHKSKSLLCRVDAKARSK